MLSVNQILNVGRMMYQCGEGPMQTKGRPESPVLRQSQSRISHTSDAVQLRLVHVLTPSGDVCIENVLDDNELEKMRADGRIVE